MKYTYEVEYTTDMEKTHSKMQLIARNGSEAYVLAYLSLPIEAEITDVKVII